MKHVSSTRRLRRVAASRRRRLRGKRAGLTSGNGSNRRAHLRLATPGKLSQRRRLSRSTPAADKKRSDAPYIAAVKNFEAAARYFRRQNYEKATEILEKLAASPVSQVAAQARVHLRLCALKLNRLAPGAKTSEDFYNLGVSELNARNLEAAIERLAKADKLAPGREHIRYALAAAHALQGNTEAALEHLKAAIALGPKNRFHARHDEDFGSLAGDPRFKRLTNPEILQTSF